MSDTGRKDLTTSLQEGLTPDSQKSGLDKAKESVTDAGDSVAATLQPGDSKSTSQKLSDETSAGAGNVSDTVQSYAKSAQDTASDLAQKAQSGGGAAGESGKTYLEQAQEVVASALTTASETAKNLADSITGSGSGPASK